jgi:hypothetical protein
METLELASVLGVHAVTVGVPLLVEVLEEGMEMGQQYPRELDEWQHRLKEEFQAKRGYWSEVWEPVLRLSPKFFEAYTLYSSLPFEEANEVPLEPKVKELIYCAIDCSTTHLFGPGLKVSGDDDTIWWFRETVADCCW